MSGANARSLCGGGCGMHMTTLQRAVDQDKRFSRIMSIAGDGVECQLRKQECGPQHVRDPSMCIVRCGTAIAFPRRGRGRTVRERGWREWVCVPRVL